MSSCEVGRRDGSAAGRERERGRRCEARRKGVNLDLAGCTHATRRKALTLRAQSVERDGNA